MASPNITTNLRHMAHGDKRQEWQVITEKRKKTQICNLHKFIPEKTLREKERKTELLGLWRALRCGSQEVARSNLSNERTFQARHCGLWLQPPAHAVLTTKKQAKLFTDSSLTSLAKTSPIPSSYCHRSWLSLSHLPSSLAFRSCSLNFSYFPFVAVVKLVVMTQRTHTLLLTRVCDTQIENVRAQILHGRHLAKLPHGFKVVQQRCCAWHVQRASVFTQHVIAQADGREEIALTKRVASSEGGGPSVQTAPS